MPDDFDFDTAAARLFGSTTPTTPTRSASAQQGGQDQSLEAAAQLLFGGNEERRANRQSAPPGSEDAVADKLFDSSLIHADAERAIAQAFTEVDLASPEQAAELAREYTPLFSAVGLTSTESALVATVAVDVAKNPPTAALVDSWVEESKAVLQRDFGPRAGEALADAQRLVDGIPELKDLLLSTGLGSHPSLVRLVAKKAAEAKRQGRLK